MRLPRYSFCAFVLAALTGVLIPAVARADIIGFGDFSGFTVNQDDSGNAPTVSNGTIRLITGAYENRSIFYNTPQNISQFTASFTYQTTTIADGACFVLQDSAAGASAVSGGWNGYGQFPGKSLAITLDGSTNSSGYFTNGNVGSGAVSTSPVNLGSGDPINVTLTYNGSLLQESLLDTRTSASYSNSYLISTKFPTVLGASTAYVGIVAGSGGSGNEYFSNFQFSSSSVPEPSTLALLGFGAIGLLGYAWRKRLA
jgi:hypothetical protein